ncbi:MAG: HD domain-containing protein [Clostridia bacterium]
MPLIKGNLISSNPAITEKSYRTYQNVIEFYSITKDLLNNPIVQQMKNYRHHYNCTCYDHCLEVAYWSYLICKKYNLDYVSSARAGMLHDLFLYDWRHSKKRLHLQHFHAFIHPQIALKNALEITSLNAKEQDIILKHMWPVTLFQVPKYKESFIITITDKISALKSFHRYYKRHLIRINL